MRSCKNCMWRRMEKLKEWGGVDRVTIFFCDNPKSPYYQEQTDKDDDCERWVENG